MHTHNTPNATQHNATQHNTHTHLGTPRGRNSSVVFVVHHGPQALARVPHLLRTDGGGE
jgi:hypothetical protein